jgi:hypothetical protein
MQHDETKAFIPSPAEQIFAHIDDPTHLSSHMSESSWMMGGGKMQIELDADRGQKIGSLIRLSGRVFGIELSLEEKVIERDPPHRKVWETTSPPRLLVIGHYRMGFELTPQENGLTLCVFIDYDLPEKPPSRWLGVMFGGLYAKWCTQQMVNDAVKHFSNLT